MATAVAAVHCQLFPEILMISHHTRIGAFVITCRPIAMAIGTWVISLVARVIRPAVEDLLISAPENGCTLLNYRERMRLEGDVATYEARYTTAGAVRRLPNASVSIVHPLLMTWPTVSPVWIRLVITYIWSGIVMSNHAWTTMKAELTSPSSHSPAFRYFRIIPHQRPIRIAV